MNGNYVIDEILQAHGETISGFRLLVEDKKIYSHILHKKVM